MIQELVLYDQMRLAIAKCAEVDEAAIIKNKAAQLEAYARVRDDAESQRKFAEIRLRACSRIGVLSSELEQDRGRPSKQISDNDVANSKTETLAKAGINIRTAERYEELAGGKEKQFQDVASAATESYFATQQSNGEQVSMGGLKQAVRQALINTFGEREKKEPAKRYEPDLLVHFLHSANWASRKGNFDPIALAAEVLEPFAQEELDSCRAFIPLLKTFIHELKQRFDNVN